MTTRIMKYNDIVFGVIGTASTFTLAHVNLIIGCIAGVLTVILMAGRVHREIKIHRILRDEKQREAYRQEILKNCKDD